MERPVFRAHRPIPLCDAHVHLGGARPLGFSVQTVRGLMARFGMERVAVQALPCSSHRKTQDPANNLKVLFAKSVLNAENPARKVYACAGLRHFFDGLDTGESLLRQARRLRAMGFDGFKMLDGKPGFRRRADAPLDGPLYEPFFAWAEAEQVPVTLHAGDPPSCWDPAHCTPEARAQGWAYDEAGGFLPLERIRAEVEGVLRRHPLLRLTLAHFFFLGDDPDEAARLLGLYPGLAFDLTPGAEMYAGFTAKRDAWRAFFEVWFSRVLFGSDSDNWHASEDLSTYDWNFGFIVNLPRDALEPGEPFRFHDADLGELVPLGLPDRILWPVYHDNFVARYGPEPAPVYGDLAAEAAGELLDRYEHGAEPDVDPARIELDKPALRAVFDRFSS